MTELNLKKTNSCHSHLYCSVHNIFYLWIVRLFLFNTIFFYNFVMIDLRVIYLLHVSCDGVSLRLLNLWNYRFYCLESLGTYFPKYFFVPIFFSPMGTLTTHLLACLKLLHNSVMLFNYSGFFLCVCGFLFGLFPLLCHQTH